MKRQNTLTTYFSKKIREETSVTDESRSSIPTIETGSSSSASQEQILEITSPQNNATNNFETVGMKEFKMKYDDLFVSNQKLGCGYCLKMESKLISNEWKECTVVQQASLRKKLTYQNL